MVSFPIPQRKFPKSTLRYVDNQEQTIESEINKTETIEHLVGTIKPLPNLTLKYNVITMIPIEHLDCFTIGRSPNLLKNVLEFLPQNSPTYLFLKSFKFLLSKSVCWYYNKVQNSIYTLILLGLQLIGEMKRSSRVTVFIAKASIKFLCLCSICHGKFIEHSRTFMISNSTFYKPS